MLNLPEILGQGNVGNVSDQDTSTDFTGRIQLIYGTSKVRTEWKGKGKKPDDGTYWWGTSDDNGKSLGTEWLGVVIATRNHALQLKAGQADMEAFDRPAPGKPPATKEQEIFMQIETKARDYKNNKDYANKAMFGSDVLFYVPSINEYGIYFMHSTASTEASNCRANKGKLVKICLQNPAPKNKQGITYNSPSVEDTDQPTEPINIDPDKLKLEYARFVNPIAKGNFTEIVQGPDGRVR